MADADAAVAIVHARGAADSVLLIRRAERESDAWSGHWSFPGGRCEAEDSGPLQTALRELEEECGIRLACERLQAVLPPALARRRVGRHLRVAPFVFAIDGEQRPALDAREAVEAVWAPLRSLRDPARHALLPVPRFPPELRFPAIDLNGVPLWGFTYRLIADWLDLNPHERPIEEAGFGAARALLDGLIAHGCVLDHGWADRAAAIDGPIPVDVVWAQVSKPAEHIPWVNMVEVRPDRVRLVGLAFEEYFIYGGGFKPRR
jgi:8-oxo-dGTP pyrophosphatase MutT (NUDIX family)